MVKELGKKKFYNTTFCIVLIIEIVVLRLKNVCFEFILLLCYSYFKNLNYFSWTVENTLKEKGQK